MAGQVMLFTDFDAAGRDAGGALGRAAQDSMFDRLSWFDLARRYTPDGEPLALRARRGDSRCWMFLSRDGRRATALSNWYCLRFATITDGSPRPPVGELIAGMRGAGIAELRLEPLAGDDPLVPALRRSGWITRMTPFSVSWRIDTAGMDFAAYWATRSSRLRNTARRKARKADLDYRFCRRIEPGLWHDLVSVFAASWKEEEGSWPLIRMMFEEEGEAGTLRLGLAYHEGKPVAAQIWTVENGVATIHKLAYREDAKKLSAGTLLSVEMFRRALDEDRVEMVDFGMGDDGYKADWMDYKLPLYQLTAFDLLRPAGLTALARALTRKIRKRLPGVGVARSLQGSQGARSARPAGATDHDPSRRSSPCRRRDA